MSKNLNLTEILKNYPKGTKLYSTIHGEVELEEIKTNDDYPIKYKFKTEPYNTTYKAAVSKDGKCCINYKGECTLFPSEKNRDGSKFSIEPKFDIRSLKHFDRVLVRNTNDDLWLIDFFSHIIKNNDVSSPLFCCMCTMPQQCIPYNDETKHLVDKTKMPSEKYITWN